jgi:uncharacterized protein
MPIRKMIPHFAVLFSTVIAAAQSFDCSKATEPHEKFICANKELSAADKEMAAAYNSVPPQLSAEGKRRLAESQRSWLKYDRNMSPLDADSIAASYRGRIGQLKKNVQTIGPFRFQAITIYYAEPVKKQPGKDEDETQDGLQSFDYTFPQIDSPETAETKRWNRLTEQHIGEMAKDDGAILDLQSLTIGGKIVVKASQPGPDTSIRADIVYASPDVISLLLHTMTYEKGAAHPNQELAGYTVLVKSGRELAASDLFDDQRDWKTALARLVFRKLKADAEHDNADLQAAGPEDILESAADTKRWTITKAGLVVTFSPDEVSSYAAGVREAVIPWQELKPHLKNPTPFPVPLM